MAKSKVKTATRLDKIKAKKAGKTSAGKALEVVKVKKVPAEGKMSSVGMTISEMSDVQFTSHLGRVLNRMKAKGVSMESMKAASIRVRARRIEALAS